MRFTPIGDAALGVSLADTPSIRPAALTDALRRDRAAGVSDVVPAFDSIAIVYDVTALPRWPDPLAALARWVRDVAATTAVNALPTAPRLIELPVTYGGDDGPDLAPLAATVHRSPGEVAALHAAAEYTVAAVGFLPGFAYLDGLPSALRVPRRATPRTRVPAGSVAVGGPYAGVYPVASPGGWHVIGRTTTTLFDPDRVDATPLRVGDRVKFVVSSRH